MTTRAAEVDADAQTWPAREPRWGRVRWLGWFLLACCALLAVTALVAGERTASYGDLRLAIAQGDVDEVTISGGLVDGSRGAATVEVHWRSGPIARVAEVIEARPPSAGPGNDLPVVSNVEDDLLSSDPDLVVHHADGLVGHTEMLGWRLPSWTGFFGLAVWLSTLMLIVGGPRPWRANRWAWFWFFVFAAPLGTIGYLLFGGPSGLAPPRVGAPRMRGGWAFVLALLASASLGVLGALIGL